MLAAGRELDALVAEQVMGWTACDPAQESRPWECGDERPSVRTGMGIPPGESDRNEIPHFSTDIAAAWEVVEKLDRDGHTMEMDKRDAGWVVRFVDYSKDPILSMEITDTAPTAPLAICLAALKAVGYESKEAT